MGIFRALVTNTRLLSYQDCLHTETGNCRGPTAGPFISPFFQETPCPSLLKLCSVNLACPFCLSNMVRMHITLMWISSVRNETTTTVNDGKGITFPHDEDARMLVVTVVAEVELAQLDGIETWNPGWRFHQPDVAQGLDRSLRTTVLILYG